jgi:membrane fusion protein, multidrug efflux system
MHPMTARKTAALAGFILLGVANAKLDLDRCIKLAATNAVQKQQVDTQKSLVDQLSAQVESDQAAIDNAKAVLGYTDLVAPIIRQIDEGNIVHATDTTGLVMLTQIKPIAVLFSLPQQLLPVLSRRFSAGALPVQIVDEDATEVIESGTIMVIDNQVDQTTGAVQIKAQFPNLQSRLWPGQFVYVRVLMDTLQQVVVVPSEAVQEGPDGDLVYVVTDDDTIEVRPVTVRQQGSDQAMIGSGLAAQERVAVSGFARLTVGTRVEVARAGEAAQPAPAETIPRRAPEAKAKDQRTQRAGTDAGP